MVCFFNELSKCPRLYPPRAAMNAEEVRIQGQRLEVMRQCGALIRDAEARPDTNLTEAESCGKEKLQRRIKAGEIVIFPTDKSGKLVLSTPDTYMEAASVHTAGDKEVSWDCLGVVEKEANRHATALRKAFRLGEGHRAQLQRMQGALRADDSPAPPLYHCAQVGPL